MADEQVVPETEGETPKVSEEQVAPEKLDAKSERGTKFVDFQNDSREEIENRFKGLYNRVKTLQRGQGALTEHNQAIAAKLDEVLNRADKSDTDSRLSRLQENRKTALDNGDMDAYGKISDQIMDVKVQSKTVAEKPPTVAPSSKADVDSINAWTYETDDAGQLIRPWAVDPSKQADLERAGQSARKAVGEDASLHDVLDEIDRSMRPKPQGGTVMSGGSPPPKKGGIELSADQKRTAANMGISEDAYAKQVANLGA